MLLHVRRSRPPASIVVLSVALIALAACGGAAGDRAAPVGSAAADEQSAGSEPPGGDTTPEGEVTADGTQPPDTATPSGPEPWSAKPAVDPVGETIEGSLVTPDGRTRTYRLYVPASLPAGAAVPLLVGLHGGTGWGAQFQRSSGFDGIAEANGFLVVFPDGVGVGPTETLRTWNGGICCGPAARDDVDDVAFVSLLIDDVRGRYEVDPARIVAAGHSNGGVMSIRLACELSEKVVAVGFQAATMSIDSCDPPVPVSMLHLHGDADENVPPQGGRGTKGISGVEWRPAMDGLRSIAAADGCPDEPATVTDPDQPELTIQRWAPCADSTVVEYVLVPGADHAWMGADAGPRSPSGPPFAGFDSSAAIWAFLAAHPRG